MNISTNRVEAFSDGVIAIIITIMVFDIKFNLTGKFSAHEETMALRKLIPEIVAYFFSFLVLGIYWVNHHHIFHLVQKVDERLLWLNLHLLFWLSLIPFPTAMLGKNPLLSESTAIYGGVLFMAAFAFSLLRTYSTKRGLMHIEQERTLNKTIDKVNRRANTKTLIVMAAYFVSVPLSYVSVYIAYACFLVAPLLFFMPDGVDDEEMAQKVDDSNKEINNQ